VFFVFARIGACRRHFAGGESRVVFSTWIIPETALEGL